MLTGIYSGASALDNYTQQQEVISTNLAHLNTPGYRRQLLSFEERLVAGSASEAKPGTNVRTLVTDFESGIKKTTGRTLDLAIAGDGFFTYQGESGEVFSKNGIVFRSPDGELVNSDGLALLSDGEPIVVPESVSNYDLVITPDGEVSANGETFGSITLAEFDDPQLLDNESQVYFKLGRATVSPAEDSTIIQGTRELANAQPVNELVGLIVGSRSFEAAQRALRTLSDTMQENVRA